MSEKENPEKDIQVTEAKPEAESKKPKKEGKAEDKEEKKPAKKKAKKEETLSGDEVIREMKENGCIIKSLDHGAVYELSNGKEVHKSVILNLMSQNKIKLMCTIGTAVKSFELVK